MGLPCTNPFEVFRTECEESLKDSVEKTFPKIIVSQFPLEMPPSLEFGDLSTSICFELAKHLKSPPKDLAESVLEALDLSGKQLIKAVKVAGGGYINFYADYTQFSSLVIESAMALDISYGYVKTDSPLRIIVEHTSVNPAGPIHIGTARNSIIGDTLYRLLDARGHRTKAHFYVDDVGRQIAVVVYGYGLLNNPQPTGKIDHWIGLVYAVTSCIIEIQSLKEKLRVMRENDDFGEEANKTQADLDDWVTVADELRGRDEKLFDSLMERIRLDKDPDKIIAGIISAYERKESKTTELVRRVVKLCLEGFRESYKIVGIDWNSWDWESDFVWDGSVSKAVRLLERTHYITQVEGVIAVDVDSAARDKGFKKLFGVSEEHEIPPLILMRSDGTTLYSTRDIAYSLWKLGQADRVINVIGVEQSLAQLQLRIAVALLTSPEKAKNLIHYPYELVKLPGYRMSKRRGRYVTFDEILKEAIKRAREEVDKRSPDLQDASKKIISEAVGVGAVKYALINVGAVKQVIFTWDKVLNFETNSAPFIQYAHARACSILRKTEGKTEKPDYSLLKEPIEQELVMKVAAFPEVFVEAADKLNSNSVSEFSNELAAKFNSFYASLPVLQAEEPSLREARLGLVKAVKVTLRNALNLLGIEALEKM
ncbi:MAG: arginyl-tRNA synthetase [Thermoproteota archaeon]|nr:arginyl-tRNA synthetase [Thermoproteota archaeon]